MPPCASIHTDISRNALKASNSIKSKQVKGSMLIFIYTDAINESMTNSSIELL